MLYIVAIDVILARRGKLEAPAKKTGPNDARRVIWALGESFSIYIRILLVLNVLYSLYLSLEETEWVSEGGDNDNGPKQCEMRHLGHK